MRTTVLLGTACGVLAWIAACAAPPPAPPSGPVGAHTDAPELEAALEPIALALQAPPVPATPLRGRVTQVGGGPLAGVGVRLMQWDELARAEAPLAETTTDAEGAFALEAPSLRGVWIAIAEPGFACTNAFLRAPVKAYLPTLALDPEESERFEPAALPGEIPLLEVALIPAAIAAIRVQGRDGTPRAGLDVEVRVMISSAVPMGGEVWEWHAMPTYAIRGRTDEHGECTLSTLPPGTPFDLRVLHDGKLVCEAGSPVGLRAGDRHEFGFAVGPLARIAGRAVDPQGAAVAGQELWLVDPRGVDRRSFSPVTQPVGRATSAADGAFAFDEVPEGVWLVGPASTKVEAGVVDADAIAACGQRVEIASDAKVVAVDVPVWRGLYVTGRVLDQAGVGLGGLLVRAFAVDESGYQYSQTTTTGAFVLGPLTGGDYEVGVSDQSSTWRSDPFVARAGERDVELRLARAGRVRCIVLDPSSTPVRVQMTSAWTPPGASAEADIDGRFDDGAYELAGLGPGRYQVLALDHQRKLAAGATVDLDAGEQRELRLTLQPGAELAIRNTGTAPVTAACSAAGGLWRTFDLPPGAWVGPLVPPGPVEVRITDPAGAELARKELTIAAGVDQTFTYPAP